MNNLTKNPWIVISLVVVVLFGGAVLLSNQENAQQSAENNVGVEVMTHVKGNPDGAVTLVEYSDLQCPACKSFVPTIDQLMTEFGDNIRFEYKHFPLPFHANAVQAAVAAEAAGQQGKFFEYHDILFDKQAEWSAVAVPTSLFRQYAESLALDMEQFERQRNASVLQEKVMSDMAEGRELGVRATPTFVLNGEILESADFGTFQRFIEIVGGAANPEKAAELFGTDAASPVIPTAEPDVRFGI